MPHSILKNALSFLPSTSPSPARSSEDRNKKTALYHAQLLQQRKDVEALILASTEALLEVPSSPAADPARPCLKDITLVKNSLKPFQPSDYDSLIEERNINKRCGYVLCPRPNRQEDTKARYRILHSKERGSDSLKFVDRRTLEQWCSDDCGKKALYVKLQLNEEPVWTRVGSPGGDILLLEDEVVAKMKALAIERGDEKAPSRSFGLAEIDVREKRDIDGKVSAPDPSTTERNSKGWSDSIEGYTPRCTRKKRRGPESGNREDEDEDEDEDMMPTI
ncbi:MAG: hypothetical protein ASARMPRED_008041 [Alectoria sarmentosa]|nr:MAG: hypothetical protein ASARMPRED_008041 [Alectoria sarmentosa]